MTTDPLPTHNTRAVPPPLGGIHSIEFLEDEIFMMGWDGDAPQPICLYAYSGFNGYTFLRVWYLASSIIFIWAID